MSQHARRKVVDHVVGDEVVVGDDVRRQVAQVTEDKGLRMLRGRNLLQSFVNIPVVAVVLDAPEGLEIDDVRGDVAVEERVRVFQHESLTGSEALSPSQAFQKAAGELDVKSRSPARSEQVEARSKNDKEAENVAHAGGDARNADKEQGSRRIGARVAAKGLARGAEALPPRFICSFGTRVGRAIIELSAPRCRVPRASKKIAKC
jgi:hypothetical protein